MTKGFLDSNEKKNKMVERTYLIGDLAKEFGITLRTLRFYQDRGLIAPRREGTTRIYSEADRARIERILGAKKLGFTLTEIRAMLAKDAGGGAELPLTEEQIETQIVHLEQQREEIDAALAELRARLEEVRSRSKAA